MHRKQKADQEIIKIILESRGYKTASLRVGTKYIILNHFLREAKIRPRIFVLSIKKNISKYMQTAGSEVKFNHVW